MLADNPTIPKDTTGRFATLEAENLLFSYGVEELTFTFRDVHGGLMLAHMLDDVGVGRFRYIVVETTDVIVADLEAGRCDIRSALNQPTVWQVDVDGWMVVQDAWVGTLGDVPSGGIPEAGVMLSWRLESDPRLTPSR